MLMEALFNHNFAVTRKTRVSDGQGGWVETWPAVGTVTGRMRPLTAAERTMALQQQSAISHVLYVAGDEDIKREDRVAGEGRTWDVLTIREPSHAGHHLEVDCREKQQEGEP